MFKGTHSTAVLCAAAVLLASAPITPAPAARADTNDEQFINTLTLHEMGCTRVSFLNCGSGGEQDLIDIGKEICAARRKTHWSESDAIAQLMRVAAKAGGADAFPFTQSMATTFVQAAETAYCPDLLGK